MCAAQTRDLHVTGNDVVAMIKTAGTLPQRAGVGLKAPHYRTIIDTTPDIGWLEVHPENYMGAGGPPHRYLEAICEHYPLSMHGVGMSLGSAEGVSKTHLQRLKQLVERYQPEQVSEHVAWSHTSSTFLNDLLPLPYTHESLSCVCNNIDQVQMCLGFNILIENPSTYIGFKEEDYTEPEFLNEVCRRTGAGLLLDVNNVYVSANNNGFDAHAYIDNIKHTLIGEVHLAGHTAKPIPSVVASPRKQSETLYIDDHGSAVSTEVWQLYDYLLLQAGQYFPTLIEWDNNIPTFDVLLAEAHKADSRKRV